MWPGLCTRLGSIDTSEFFQNINCRRLSRLWRQIGKRRLHMNLEFLAKKSFLLQKRLLLFRVGNVLVLRQLGSLFKEACVNLRSAWIRAPVGLYSVG